MQKRAEILKNFIVLEGLDGSGTTTLLKLLKNRCDSAGIKYFTTCEPTNSPTGVIIRKILKNKIKVEPSTLAKLFTADRNEHLYNSEQGIIVRLNKGETVFCDRYLFSSLAYQSVASGFDFVLSLNRYPLPEHLFFIDVPSDVCQKRMSERKAVELFEHISIQKTIRDYYYKSFEYFKDTDMKINIINGTQELSIVFEKIWSNISSFPI